MISLSFLSKVTHPKSISEETETEETDSNLDIRVLKVKEYIVSISYLLHVVYYVACNKY